MLATGNACTLDDVSQALAADGINMLQGADADKLPARKAKVEVQVRLPCVRCVACLVLCVLARAVQQLC
jgi:hypothetical protein